MMFTTTKLADLRAGDRLLSLDGRPYRAPLLVTVPLSPIEPGLSVEGVRFQNPNPTSQIEWVFCPGQADGHALEVERP
jgi:hypothetical protein